MAGTVGDLRWRRRRQRRLLWAQRPCLPFQGQNSAWAIGGGANGSGLACGAMYPNGAKSWMIYGPFSLQGMTAAELRFMLWLNTQPQADGVCHMASVDGVNFGGTCTAGNSLGWIERRLDFRNVPNLGNLVGSPQVWIGISFLSNDSVSYPQGAFVDNVILNKCLSGCPSPSALSPGDDAAAVVEYPVIMTTGR